MDKTDNFQLDFLSRKSFLYEHKIYQKKQNCNVQGGFVLSLLCSNKIVINSYSINNGGLPAHCVYFLKQFFSADLQDVSKWWKSTVINLS